LNFINDDEEWVEAAKIKEVLGWTVERKDPYGFFHFVQKGKKKIPDELSGSFTTLLKIENAIRTYEQKNKDKDIKNGS